MTKNTSFIRWAGGKGWFVPAVQNIIRDLKYNNYIEPFLGGGSVFFSLDVPHRAFLSDVNEELINAYVQIRDNLEMVIELLKDYKPDKDTYYIIRNQEPEELAEKAARFLYLNFYSFNGIYRVNSKGKYNVPYGRREGTFNYDRLDEIRKKLKKAEIACQDFAASKRCIKKNDLVFLDPPYAVANKASGNELFIAYNPTLFSLEDQLRLADLIQIINKCGAYYIMTNAHHPEIAKIFKGKGEMLEIDRTCNIGGLAARRGKVKEYVFTNIPGIRKEVLNNV